MAKLTLTAPQIKPGDVLIRTRQSQEISRYVIAEVKESTQFMSARYGFITAPHGDFLGWFSAGSKFTVERA